MGLIIILATSLAYMAFYVQAAGVPVRDCDIFCIQIYLPVCGSDGKTYYNSCALRIASCKNPRIYLRHNGPCYCLLPKVVGPCKARIPRYFYNAISRNCELFYYGGCKGNKNNFKTKAACEATCKRRL